MFKMSEARCTECGDLVEVTQGVLKSHWVNQGDDPDNRSILCAGSDRFARYDLPEYVRVLFLALWVLLEKSFKRKSGFDWWEHCYTLEIEGLTLSPYHEESDEPNFIFSDVQLWWYKRPGRSMEANVNWDVEQWTKWFNACATVLKDWENIKWSERRGKTPNYDKIKAAFARPDDGKESCVECFEEFDLDVSGLIPTHNVLDENWQKKPCTGTGRKPL